MTGIEGLGIDELYTSLLARKRELRLTVDPESRNTLLAQQLNLRSRIWAVENELYFTLDLPEPLPELSKLSVEALDGIYAGIQRSRRVLLAPRSQGSPEEGDRLRARDRMLTLQQEEILAEIQRRQAALHEPQPGTNSYYLDQFKDHPWYPAILKAHLELEELIPGYNITDIKEKFGGLRYYFSYPDPLVLQEDRYERSTEDRIMETADRIIARAEGWVDGYEHSRRTDDLLTED